MLSWFKKEEISLKQTENYKTACAIEKEIYGKMMKVDHEIIIDDVEIKLYGINTFIHTSICGIDNEETLVLLHGFGGSGLTFCKMLPLLSKKYRALTPDFIGMGLSDRKEFPVEQTAQGVIDFFVESIVKWAEVFQLKKFKLAGHSFGGYIASHFILKYPEMIEEIFLLSPMASEIVSPSDDLSNKENFDTYLKNQPLITKLSLKVKKFYAQDMLTPGQVLQKWFIPRNLILKNIVEKRLKVTDSEEATQWKEFLKNMFNLPKSTEQYIHYLLIIPGNQAKYSIEQAYKERKVKFSMRFTILFGDDDWNASNGCQNLIDEKIINGRVIIIENAGHQFLFHQPIDLSDVILKSDEYHEQQI